MTEAPPEETQPPPRHRPTRRRRPYRHLCLRGHRNQHDNRLGRPTSKQRPMRKNGGRPIGCANPSARSLLSSTVRLPARVHVPAARSRARRAGSPRALEQASPEFAQKPNQNPILRLRQLAEPSAVRGFDIYERARKRRRSRRFGCFSQGSPRQDGRVVGALGSFEFWRSTRGASTKYVDRAA